MRLLLYLQQSFFGACFSPHKDLTSLHTFDSCPFMKNPLGYLCIFLLLGLHSKMSFSHPFDGLLD